MIRIGILGAGGIAERAVVEPARDVDGVEVVAIGARDPERARSFAERLDLPIWGDTLASGMLGRIQRVEIDFSIPHFVVKPGNIRLDGDLAGGAVMDVGCYAVDLLRAAWGEPEVVSATAVTYDADPRIDLQTDAQLRLPGGIPASVRASFLGDDKGAMVMRVHGSAGSLEATSVIVPQWGATLTVTSSEGQPVRTTAAVPGENSYARQLEHLAAVLGDGSPSILDARRGVGTMRVVDDIYRAAGLLPR